MKLWKGAVALVCASVLIAVPAGLAAKPGPGTSTGTGSVFVSNPVEDLNDQSLRDQKDSDAAVPAAAYHTVGLTDLDGSGFLRGRWATIVSETGNPAYSPTNTFLYTRSEDEFEQVMGYYWVTESQKYIQELGFGMPGTGLAAVNMEPQRLRINQWGADNSFATTHKDEIRLGKGGVDDAEDGEVITHEYGHAIHFSQNFNFSGEGGAISEGFGDYWAVTTTLVVRQKLGLPPLTDPACVADWDATSYDPTPPHCLRRVDLNLHYPENLVGQVHADGRIWSRALWDIRNAVGNVQADTSILLGQFNFPGTTMTELANRIVEAAQARFGNPTANTVRAQFVARGILT